MYLLALCEVKTGKLPDWQLPNEPVAHISAHPSRSHTRCSAPVAAPPGWRAARHTRPGQGCLHLPQVTEHVKARPWLLPRLSQAFFQSTRA